MPVAIIGSPPFRARLRAIHLFLDEIGAAHRYEQLLDDMEQVVFPNIRSFPLIGRPYLDDEVRSTEALMALARLPREAKQQLRQYVHGDFTVLYAATPEAIHLVSIRHHRESTFIP